MKKFIHAAALLAPLALVLANGSAAIAQDAQPQPQPTPAPTPAPKPPQLPDPSPSGVSTMWKYGYHDGKCWLYEILIQTQGSASKMTIISTIASVREIPCDKVPAGALPPRTASTSGTTTGQSGTTGTGAGDPPPPPPPGWPQGVSKSFEGDDEIWTYPDGHKERFRRPKESDASKNAGTGVKQSANDASHQTGMTTPHEKQETNAAASVEHAARTDSHATDSVPVRKTSAATATRSHVKTMSNLGHSAIGTSRMASLAHSSSMVSHLGGGMMHMGGMHMGGMHMGGMHMGGMHMGMR
jgi:hypothetical protein